MVWNDLFEWTLSSYFGNCAVRWIYFKLLIEQKKGFVKNWWIFRSFMSSIENIFVHWSVELLILLLVDSVWVFLNFQSKICILSNLQQRNTGEKKVVKCSYFETVAGCKETKHKLNLKIYFESNIKNWKCIYLKTLFRYFCISHAIKYEKIECRDTAAKKNFWQNIFLVEWDAGKRFIRQCLSFIMGWINFYKIFVAILHLDMCNSSPSFTVYAIDAGRKKKSKNIKFHGKRCKGLNIKKSIWRWDRKKSNNHNIQPMYLLLICILSKQM